MFFSEFKRFTLDLTALFSELSFIIIFTLQDLIQSHPLPRLSLTVTTNLCMMSAKQDLKRSTKGEKKKYEKKIQSFEK